MIRIFKRFAAHVHDSVHARDQSTRVHAGLFVALQIAQPKRVLMFMGCLAVAVAAALWLGADDDLSAAGQRALFILIFAALLWVTEPIPPFAVALLIIGLEIALLGNPAGPYAETWRDWEQFVVVFGHPLVWLFFGGFVLAAGMARAGLDRQLARAVLKRLGAKPAHILLGVMGITFVLSMFVSNTATTAMMLALLAPVFLALEGDRFATGMVVGVAVAANVGGMGSLIGTPPNAIAVGALGSSQQINFLEWMALGLPVAVVLLFLAWFFLVKRYPSRSESLELDAWNDENSNNGERPPRWQRLVVGGTLFATVGLWLTSQWHGIPTAAVSFLPIVALTTTGVLNRIEIRSLNYDILFLIAGGLALGQVVASTGLSQWLVDRVPFGGLGVVGVAMVMAYLTVALSNFMSNTAATNILVPIGVSMATGAEALTAVPIALAASASMCLPIATPPNALAYATGRCETKDLVMVGLVMGVVGPAITIAWTSIAVRWFVG